MKKQSPLYTLKERFSFLKSWVKNPRAMGSIIPSSPAIGKLMGKHIKLQDSYVIEIGAGTGTLTQGLLKTGIPAKNLILVEINKSLIKHLRRKFPQLTIIQGDAQNLQEILPDYTKGKISTIVSGLPFVSLPKKVSYNILKSIEIILPENGKFLQFSYLLWKSPIKVEKFGFHAQLLGRELFNFPPATVWEYSKKPASSCNLAA